MTQKPTPRFWLLATAALIFGSPMSASAQTHSSYQSGAPTMVAAAPSLPSLSAERIAQDVTSEFNPRTGAREFIAAPFDPFEEDPTLAASLRLRSADGMSAIDGQRLRDGAVVEIDFYYNSPSDDPYGGRNYSDARFVNGELTPVALRDTRILECSTRVENVVYDHVNYYGSGYSGGVYRPYQHYTGHSGFGFGFGSSYFGPGYGYSSNRSYYGNSRSFGNSFVSGSNRSRSRSRNRLTNTRSRNNGSRRNSDEDRNRSSDERRRDRDARRRDTESQRRDNESRRNRRNVDGNQRANPERRSDTQRLNARASRAQRELNSQRRNNVAPQAQTSSTEDAGRRSTNQNETRQRRSRQLAGQRSQSARPKTSREKTRNKSSDRASDSRSNSRSNSRSKSKAKKSRPSASGQRVSSRNNKRQLNFFPNDGYGGRRVVSSRSVDCAREDKLRVFISNARLDAARFDGLTLIALDAQGGETPIYLPPNYIEGFRIAATGRQGQGRAQPQSYQSAPQNTYGSPSPRIEAAPCPSGTSKQPDGTCLQVGQFGYPTR